MYTAERADLSLEQTGQLVSSFVYYAASIDGQQPELIAGHMRELSMALDREPAESAVNSVGIRPVVILGGKEQCDYDPSCRSYSTQAHVRGAVEMITESRRFSASEQAVLIEEAVKAVSLPSFFERQILSSVSPRLIKRADAQRQVTHELKTISDFINLRYDQRNGKSVNAVRRSLERDWHGWRLPALVGGGVALVGAGILANRSEG